MVESPTAALVPPSADIKKFRLIVTGHDDGGQSVFLTDQIADNSTASAKDPCQVPFVVAPPTGGCVFRVVEFPPDHHWQAKVDAMGGSAPVDETARVAKGGAVRHGQMHRTRSLDFAIVLSGEIWAIMDVGEKKMVAGDMLVQRGTNHAWANRSDKPCNVVFILIDAKPLD